MTGINLAATHKKRQKEGKIRLEILPDGTLQVTAPPHIDPAPFLEQKKAWIEKKIRERERIARQYPGGDDLFLLHGSLYRLTEGNTCAVLEDTVTYTTPGALKEWLSMMLRREVEEHIVQYAPHIGRLPQNICIRAQRTRWGSCSGESTLNFNLAMMALPPELRTYIILHEIVHLVERNHAPAFWICLGTLCPAYQTHRKELKKYWILVERNTIWQVLRAG
jgi:predicted metal-dependent hydrolase